MLGKPDEHGDEECMIVSPDGSHRLLFIEVPEAERVENRVHVDLVPAEGARDAELARLLDLGSTSDPAGDEFCILRSDAERAGATP